MNPSSISVATFWAVPTPANAEPIITAIGTYHERMLSVPKSGRVVTPANCPLKAITKNTGITSTGMNVEGSRRIAMRLRRVSSRATRDVDA